MRAADQSGAQWKGAYLRQLCHLECYAEVDVAGGRRLCDLAGVGQWGAGAVIGSIACGWRSCVCAIPVEFAVGARWTVRVLQRQEWAIQRNGSGTEGVYRDLRLQVWRGVSCENGVQEGLEQCSFLP